MTLVRDGGRSPRRWGKIALIVVAVILAIPLFSPIVLRTLLFHPFYIPAGSMMPTLLVGDSLFVSKYAYGYSRYSLPFSPRLFPGRIFGLVPERGDVVVFRIPKDDSVDYIKRVVGLPGDTIQMRQGLLFDNGFYDNTNVYKVPDGHVFVLGDNRDNSTDSRVLSAVGYIPLENIVGRAGLIYFSRAPRVGGARSIVRSERIGMVVR